MSRQPGPAGTAGQHIARDVALFNPAERVFQAMLDGWRNQQLSRNLAFTGARNATLRALVLTMPPPVAA